MCSQVLPPGAAQVQPLVEAFFVLADVRTKLKAPADEADRCLGCAGCAAAA